MIKQTKKTILIDKSFSSAKRIRNLKTHFKQSMPISFVLVFLDLKHSFSISMSNIKDLEKRTIELVDKVDWVSKLLS